MGYRFVVCCSVQLSYTPITIGAGGFEPPNLQFPKLTRTTRLLHAPSCCLLVKQKTPVIQDYQGFFVSYIDVASGNPSPFGFWAMRLHTRWPLTTLHDPFSRARTLLAHIIIHHLRKLSRGFLPQFWKNYRNWEISLFKLVGQKLCSFFSCLAQDDAALWIGDFS